MTASRNFRLIAATAATLLCACAPKDGRSPSTVAPPSHPLITLDSHDDIPLDFPTPRAVYHADYELSNILAVSPFPHSAI